MNTILILQISWLCLKSLLGKLVAVYNCVILQFKRSIKYYFLLKWKHRSRSTVDLPITFPLNSLNLGKSTIDFCCTALHPYHVSFSTSQLIRKDCNPGLQMLQCLSYGAFSFQRNNGKEMLSVTMSSQPPLPGYLATN